MRAARYAVFFVAVAFMMFGPFYRQVLGSKNKVFRNWVMFAGVALKICDVDYVEMVDGEPVPLDRYQVLGHDNWRTAPRWVRRVQSDGGVQRVANRLCQERREDGARPDIRAYSRCASRKKGWVAKHTGERNLCGRHRSKRR